MSTQPDSPIEYQQLYRGDGLKILPETTEFYFGCCDCGLVHRIEVTQDETGTTLRFYREKAINND